MLDVLAPVAAEGDVVPWTAYEKTKQYTGDPGAYAHFTHHNSRDGLVAVAANCGHRHRSPEHCILLDTYDCHILGTALRAFARGNLRLGILRRRRVLLGWVLS